MSGAVDESTRRTIAEGRQTLGSALSAAQTHLQKVFIAFVIGFMGTFYLMRAFVWAQLKQDLISHTDASVIARTPFDVILLQAKIGLAVGALVSVPFLIYYSRAGLRRHGLWPAQKVAWWKLLFIVVSAVFLFLVGAAYSYLVFFPVMFDFLAGNAVSAGFNPTYSIVKWTQFIALLTLSFGLAAQLPLAMSALAYANIVSYEFFRDNWRYAVVLIFAFGALFSPPDPFTQIMWALPLIGLYAFSLQVTRVVVVAKRAGSEVDVLSVALGKWNVLAGTALLTFFAVWAFFQRYGIPAINDVLLRVPYVEQYAPVPTLTAATGLSQSVAVGLLAGGVTLVVLCVATFHFVATELEKQAAQTMATNPRAASVGDPADIDIGPLDAAGVRAAPPEVFVEMSEDDALRLANEAVDEGDKAKAQAILDRFDEAEEMGADAAEAAAAQDDEDVLTSTTAGMVDAFTEEDTTEDDIGGYFYDIRFILDSLMSKAFWIVGQFMVVLAATFVILYDGGIKRLKEEFTGNLPDQLASQVEIVTLHPVEALIFMVKVSTLLAVVSVIPLIMYFAWPALKERGLAGGDRRVLLVWGGTLMTGIVGGSLVGFIYVAPAIISWLAQDVLQAQMVIAYRVNNFGWLVLFTTIGIGLLANIPLTMLLFHRGRIVTFEKMWRNWRTVVIAIVTFGAVASPKGIFTMLLLAIPTALAFLFGLVLLWLLTLGGRTSASAS
jgi:sec-independent protein translocase protein TatC